MIRKWWRRCTNGTVLDYDRMTHGRASAAVDKVMGVPGPPVADLVHVGPAWPLAAVGRQPKAATRLDCGDQDAEVEFVVGGGGEVGLEDLAVGVDP